MSSHDDITDFSDELEQAIDDRWMMLASLDEQFFRGAVKWWNFECSAQLRQLIVGAAYYESMAHSAMHIDDYLEELTGDNYDDDDE